MAKDEDFRVRFVCAERLPVPLLGALVDDEDEVVREAALGPQDNGERVMGLGPRAGRRDPRPAGLHARRRRSARSSTSGTTEPIRGREIGDILVRKGEVGYVRDIGTFLQQFYIYAVEWIDSGTIVGMRGKELVQTRSTRPRPAADEGNRTMKVMIRRGEKGLSAYVPKKDLEEPIVETERETLWGGSVKLRNGWTLILPDMPPETKLPITVNARKLGEERMTAAAAELASGRVRAGRTRPARLAVVRDSSSGTRSFPISVPACSR